MITKDDMILITGASGFIGTNLIELFEQKGYTFVNYDKADATKENQHQYWHKGNIMDKDALAAAFDKYKPSIVIHLAARTDTLSDNLEEGFQYFPSDQITDHPERFLVSEMIREKVLQLTREEIPHSVAVVIDSMKRDEETDTVHIRATIMVERDSQKGIVIGKKGAMLKKIGTLARKDIELMLGDKVFLETWVKVKKNWRDKKLDLADFGYNEKEY